MTTQTVQKTEPEKDRYDSLPGFCISTTLPDSDRQRILHNFQKQINLAFGVPRRYLGRDLAGEVQA